ncbi:MAG TPA: YdaS family helix-turn-helix protein [Limnobacter sp.]|uniref:YdaS family helix-turn-helix protein n=1 Tax=Limnobacter sp. TaxID=2003368 RepID=UPI002ED8BFFE
MEKQDQKKSTIASDVIKQLGGTTAVGRMFGLSPQNVNGWRERGFPDKYVRKISELTGIDINTLRRPLREKDKSI